MPTDWEAAFSRWGSSPSQTETEKCYNAEGVIRKAILASPVLSAKSIRVFAQGSYRNRTNVRGDSDVDICVLCSDSVFYDNPAGFVPLQFAIGPLTYTFASFKSDVESALRTRFGAGVSPGSKAFDVHENTYRIAADVVPCFEYRWYHTLGQPPYVGTAFLSNGRRIFNYPDQHYNMGVSKNENTNRRFKAVARVLKTLRYEMMGKGIQSAAAAPSFAIESLVWNVPDSYFTNAVSLRGAVVSATAHAIVGSETDDGCKNWREVNGIKFLFRDEQAWTRAGIRNFLLEAWIYAEMGKE